MLNEEGGIDPLEYRFYSSIDRINTTGTAWLGLTVGCAQCHDHKCDPISQKDYYSLFSFMENMQETDIERFMREEFVETGSDGSDGHPRKYGTFPRKYRRYVAGRGLISTAWESNCCPSPLRGSSRSEQRAKLTGLS